MNAGAKQAKNDLSTRIIAERGKRLFLGHRVCLTQQRALHLGGLQGSCHTSRSVLLCSGDFACGKYFPVFRTPFLGLGVVPPAGPVLSPLLLLPALQLRVSSWAAAELVSDISDGPLCQMCSLLLEENRSD